MNTRPPRVGTELVLSAEATLQPAAWSGREGAFTVQGSIFESSWRHNDYFMLCYLALKLLFLAPLSFHFMELVGYLTHKSDTLSRPGTSNLKTSKMLQNLKLLKN